MCAVLPTGGERGGEREEQGSRKTEMMMAAIRIMLFFQASVKLRARNHTFTPTHTHTHTLSHTHTHAHKLSCTKTEGAHTHRQCARAYSVCVCVSLSLAVSHVSFQWRAFFETHCASMATRQTASSRQENGRSTRLALETTLAISSSSEATRSPWA